MIAARTTPAVRRRVVFLALGNALLIGVILAVMARGGQRSPGSVLAELGGLLGGAARDVSPVALAGLGLTGVIFTGAIDLSIGSIIVVAGTVFGVLYEYGCGPLSCGAGCFLTAWLLSAANGALVRALGLPAIIVTLAGLPLYRGLALILAEISVDHFPGDFSIQDDRYRGPGRDAAGWLLLGAALVALAWEAWGKTPRTWLAHGSSPEACRRHGLRPGSVQAGAFAAGGLFLGLAALVLVTNRQTIDPARMARGFELQVIAAVVLGGTNVFGGEGSYAGTLLAAFFLYFAQRALLFADVGPYWRDALQGALILAVLAADCATHRRHKLVEELR